MYKLVPGCPMVAGAQKARNAPTHSSEGIHSNSLRARHPLPRGIHATDEGGKQTPAATKLAVFPFDRLVAQEKRPNGDGRAPPTPRPSVKQHIHPRLGRAKLYFRRGRDERDLSGVDTARAKKPNSPGRIVGGGDGG